MNKLRDESCYLNTFLVWGVFQYDPAHLDNVKDPNPPFAKGRHGEKMMPGQQTSRFLTREPTQYLT